MNKNYCSIYKRLCALRPLYDIAKYGASALAWKSDLKQTEIGKNLNGF